MPLSAQAGAMSASSELVVDPSRKRMQRTPKDYYMAVERYMKLCNMYYVCFHQHVGLGICYHFVKNHDKLGNRNAFVKHKLEWTSDTWLEDEKLQWSLSNEGRKLYCECINFLGFHPYKEIIFLSEWVDRGLAYHLKSSKVEELGNIYPKGYDR
ncbi:hypothetical protein EJB05_51787, partial [Eragrostis curvula]